MTFLFLTWWLPTDKLVWDQPNCVSTERRRPCQEVFRSLLPNSCSSDVYSCTSTGAFLSEPMGGFKEPAGVLGRIWHRPSAMTDRVCFVSMHEKLVKDMLGSTFFSIMTCSDASLRNTHRPHTYTAQVWLTKILNKSLQLCVQTNKMRKLVNLDMWVIHYAWLHGG